MKIETIPPKQPEANEIPNTIYLLLLALLFNILLFISCFKY